jgi:hypothetical protein
MKTLSSKLIGLVSLVMVTAIYILAMVSGFREYLNTQFQISAPVINTLYIISVLLLSTWLVLKFREIFNNK